jgi:hypothetical protein
MTIQVSQSPHPRRFLGRRSRRRGTGLWRDDEARPYNRGRTTRGTRRRLGVGRVGPVNLNRALRIAELRDGLLEGRAAVLDARLEVYSVNFGEASRHLEAARSALRAAEARLNSLGRQADTKLVELALAKIDEAQRMAGQLNQDANALAAEASKAINDVLDTTVNR